MLGKGKNKPEKDVVASDESVPAKSSVRLDHAFVSSGSKKINLRLPNFASKPLLPLIAAVLVITGGGAFYFYMQSRQSKPVSTTPEDSDNELAYRQRLLANDNYKATYADYLILGNEYLEREDYASAEEQYKKAESMDGSNFDVAYALANVYRLQKDKENSLQYYDKAIQIASRLDGGPKLSLELYKAERTAVESGDFELKKVEYPSEMPL